MPESRFPVNNKVHFTFTPISIPNKNTRELGNTVNPTSLKLFLRFLDVLCSHKTLIKMREKQFILSLYMKDIDISPSGFGI